MIFAVGSTPWLLAHELRLTRRGLLAAPGMRWRAPIVVFAFLAIGALLGGPAALALRGRTIALTSAMAIVAAIATGAVFTLMLSRTLAEATEALYARGDLDLLFSSPIGPRRVLFVRCAAIATNVFAGFALLVSPLALPVGLLARPAWLAIYPVLGALALAATSAGLMIAIVLFRLIGPKRTRTVSQILAVLIGAAIFLSSQISRLGHRSGLTDWPALLTGGGAGAPLPQGLVSWPLRAETGEPLPLLFSLAVSAVVFLLATAWVGRRFGTDAAAAAGAGASGSSAGGQGAFAGGAFRVTLRKELRLLRRDIPLLAQVLLRLVYLLPLVFVLLRNAGSHLSASLPLGVGIVVFMCGQVAGSLVWITVAAEDAPDLIGCAPASVAVIRRAKLCAALAPLIAILALPLIALLVLAPLAGVAAFTGCAAVILATALIGFALQRPARRSAFARRGSGSLVAALTEFGAGAVVAGAAGAAVVWPAMIAALAAVAAAAAWTLWRNVRPVVSPIPTPSLLVH